MPSRVSMKVIGALNDCAARSNAASQNRSEKRCRAEYREQFCPPAEGEVFSLDIPFYRTADQTGGGEVASLITRVATTCRSWRFSVWRKMCRNVFPLRANSSTVRGRVVVQSGADNFQFWMRVVHRGFHISVSRRHSADDCVVDGSLFSSTVYENGQAVTVLQTKKNEYPAPTMTTVGLPVPVQ